MLHIFQHVMFSCDRKLNERITDTQMETQNDYCCLLGFAPWHNNVLTTKTIVDKRVPEEVGQIIIFDQYLQLR